ncbi:MAG TPA: hypothetical protein VEU96_01530 [Bryobacteraceae bacterium]|nr:hypothetical protein [Bryobacteraceae bacterium]
MTETGKAAAVWLITATQTNLFKIFSIAPAQRTPTQQHEIAGLEDLDATFQKHQANLAKAKQFLDQAAPIFRTIMQDASYSGDQCPSAQQVAAMAEKGL